MKDLKQILLPIALLFMIVVGSTEIAYGNSSSVDNDSCICYTDEMDMKALECIKNAHKRDSILQNNALLIFNFSKINEHQSILIADKNVQIIKKDEDIHKISLNLERSKKMVKATMFGGLGIGFICGILLSR